MQSDLTARSQRKRKGQPGIKSLRHFASALRPLRLENDPTDLTLGTALNVMTPKPKKGIVQRGGWAVVKKLLKAIPIIGPVFTVGFAGHDIKKKGLVPGAVHVGLDVTPIVGTAKNVLEIFTGDWIPDKVSKTPQPQVASPLQGNFSDGDSQGPKTS